MTISISSAEALNQAVQQVSRQMKLPAVSAAVCDAAGHLLAFSRMDGSMLASIDIALGKARTVALFQRSSLELGGMFVGNDAAHSLWGTNGGMVVIGGGVLLRDARGVIAGSLGVSGGSPDEDELIARSAAETFGGG